MSKFDTSVQELKYKVLKEVAKLAFDDNLAAGVLDIPEKIIKGPNATMRCCIYKERAIVGERVKIAMGGDKQNDNVVEVLDIACDECPVTQFSVGPACRGCIAHRCIETCPRKAISITNMKAHIDTEKCVACGRCMGACPYSAIIKLMRPCEQACKPKAISMDENKKAKIDDSKCIHCGACVYQCPFGAISDKSYILDAIDIIKKSENNTKYKVYAVVAPSVASQFGTANMGQIVAGLKELGFYNAVEAALGADMVAYLEAQELKEKGFLTSSCCPAFVTYIEKQFPTMKEHISHNVSPMVQIGKYIKMTDETAKIIFIGPCVAKKAERKLERVKDIIDCVITFEELQALYDAKEIELGALEPQPLDNASYYGRIFARSGGLADAVAQALKEQNVSEEEFALNAVACSGIEECKMALLKASKGVLPNNFIEGMACVNGCIGGAACITHGPKDKADVDNYGRLALEKNISDSISIYKLVENAHKRKNG